MAQIFQRMRALAAPDRRWRPRSPERPSIMAEARIRSSGRKAYGLQSHFDSFEQQQEASYLGMWAFLVTEILFFGGVFTAYLVYRTANQLAFAAASNMLDLQWGTINTAVLIGSSLTMALAVWAALADRESARSWRQPRAL